mgnify:CR=1 FL=1
MKSLVRLMARDFFCIAFTVLFANYASVECISISVEVNSTSVESISISVEVNSTSVESHSMK